MYKFYYIKLKYFIFNVKKILLFKVIINLYFIMDFYGCDYYV